MNVGFVILLLWHSNNRHDRCGHCWAIGAFLVGENECMDGLTCGRYLFEYGSRELASVASQYDKHCLLLNFGINKMAQGFPRPYVQRQICFLLMLYA